jgi:hypothetical protein
MKSKRDKQGDLESEYFQSKEFKDAIKKQIKKDTWSKGLPMVYLNSEGQIVKEWEDGRIEIVKSKLQ